MRNGQLQIVSPGHMRGLTLKHSYVTLDEAQNLTRDMMKMILTRIGEGSRIVVTGDPGQIDLDQGIVSGLVDAEERLARVEGVAVVTFGHQDVVREPFVQRVLEAYSDSSGSRESQLPSQNLGKASNDSGSDLNRTMNQLGSGHPAGSESGLNPIQPQCVRAATPMKSFPTTPLTALSDRLGKLLDDYVEREVIKRLDSC